MAASMRGGGSRWHAARRLRQALYPTACWPLGAVFAPDEEASKPALVLLPGASAIPTDLGVRACMRSLTADTTAESAPKRDMEVI